MALVEPLAYGDMGLKPWEFERLTRREFELMLAGARRRSKRDVWLAAFNASIVLAAWVKNPKTAEQLLGWPKDWDRG